MEDVNRRVVELLKRRQTLSLARLAEEFEWIIRDVKDFDGFPLDNFVKNFLIVCIKPLKRNQDPNVFGIVERILTSISAVPEMKRPLLTSENLLPSLIDIITSKETPLQTKKDTLEVLNKISSLKISAECRSGLRKRYASNFDKLAEQLKIIGDYEAQITILEVFLRFCGQQDFASASKWFESEKLAKKFMSIERKLFEAQSRPLLNAINLICGEQALVKSFPCKKMMVGQRLIQKPLDEGYDELWIDFNIVSRVIRVYCQKHPSVDLASKWDSMTIEASDILNYDLLVNSKKTEKLLKIHLAREGYRLFDSSAVSTFPGFVVEMLFKAEYPIKETVMEMFPRRDIENMAKSNSQMSHDIIANTQTPLRGAAYGTKFDINQNEESNEHLNAIDEDVEEIPESPENISTVKKNSFKLSLSRRKSTTHSNINLIASNPTSKISSSEKRKSSEEPENQEKLSPPKRPNESNKRKSSEEPENQTKLSPPKRPNESNNQLSKSKTYVEDLFEDLDQHVSVASKMANTKRPPKSRQSTQDKRKPMIFDSPKSHITDDSKLSKKRGRPRKSPEKSPKRDIFDVLSITSNTKKRETRNTVPKTKAAKDAIDSLPSAKSTIAKRKENKKKVEQIVKPKPKEGPAKRTVATKATNKGKILRKPATPKIRTPYKPVAKPVKITTSTKKKAESPKNTIVKTTNSRKAFKDIQNTYGGDNLGPAHSTMTEDIDKALFPDDVSNIAFQTGKPRKFFKNPLTYSRQEGSTMTKNKAKSPTKMYSIFDDISSVSSVSDSSIAQRLRKKKETKKTHNEKNLQKKLSPGKSSASSSRSLLRENNSLSSSENVLLQESAEKVKLPASPEVIKEVPMEIVNDEISLIEEAQIIDENKIVDNANQMVNDEDKENEAPNEIMGQKSPVIEKNCNDCVTPLTRKHKSPIRPRKLVPNEKRGNVEATDAGDSILALNSNGLLEQIARKQIHQDISSGVQMAMNEFLTEVEGVQLQIKSEMENTLVQIKRKVNETLQKVNQLMLTYEK